MGHKDVVSGFSFCQHAGQSHICVSSSSDGSVRFWDTDSNALIRERAAHQVSGDSSCFLLAPPTVSAQCQHNVTTLLFFVSLHTNRPPSQHCTGPRWITPWWCLVMRRALWSVIGTTQGTALASFLSPGPSSASPARLTPGAPWLWGKETTLKFTQFADI